MTPKIWYVIAVILVIWAITFLLRLAPFVLLSRLRDNQIVQYLGVAMPAGVMLILVVFTLNEVSILEASQWVPPACGVAVTAVLHLWKSNVMVSLIGGVAAFGLVLQLF